MARQRQVSWGTRRAGGAGSGEHRTGWAVESWLRLFPGNFIWRLGRRSPRCSLHTCEAARSGQQAPGVAGCFKISAGRDRWGQMDWGTAASQAYTKSLLRRGTWCLPRATEEPHRSTGGRGAKARQGLLPDSRSLGSPCLNFPETEDRVYYPVPEGPEFGFRLYPGERVLLMLQECGKL